MGYDYSGGGLGGPNRYWAETIRRIRAGETRPQQDRALMDKIAMTALSTGIGAVGHVIEGHRSAELEKQQASKAQMGEAITSQTKERNRLLQAPDDYKPSDDGSTEGPEWLRTGKVQHGKDWFPEEPKDQGPVDLGLATDQHKQNQETNVAAAGANIGGYRTPKALDDHDRESDTLDADMNTGKNMIKMGGMMGSLPRKY